MQKRFLKLAFVGAVFASTAFAGNTDLLSAATDGAVVTSKNSNAQVLSENEMKEVVGGSWEYIASDRVNNSVYVQVDGRVTENYLGYQAKLYARRMYSNGSTTVWVNYYKNGSWTTAYGTEAVRLQNLYGPTARSYL